MGAWRWGRWGLAAAWVVLGAALASAAQAAEPSYPISIARQSRRAALMELARQTGVSLGFPSDLQCPGEASASGRMTLSAALDALLHGSGCAPVRIDERTIAIVARPRPSEPPPRPAAEPATITDLAELVVTATKRETSLRSAPYALTALDGEALSRQGVAGAEELSALAAGVTVTNLGPGRDKVLLRGLSDSPLTGHSQSTVGIYLDDLRLTYNAPDPDLPWLDVKQVEVLRGPQGSLYGAGSMGGILHVITNAPDPASRSGALSVGAAATQRGGPSYDLNGVINQPIGVTAAVRLVGWKSEAGGYIDNLATGRKDVDLTWREGFRGEALWQIRPDLALSAAVVEQSINSRDTHYAQPAVGSLARSVPSAEPHDNDFMALDLGLRWTLPAAEVSLTTGALEHDVASRYDASRAPASLAPAGETPKSFDDDNDIIGLVNEARIASRGPGRLQWLGGAFAAFGRQDLSGLMLGEGGGVGYQELRRDRLLETALFGELSYEMRPWLTVTVGGRLFRSRVSTRSEVSLAGQARRLDGATSDSGLAPKFLIAFRPDPELTVYAQATEGYRAGGFNTSGPPGQPFGDGPGAPQPLRRYAGDEIWSYEAGVRWRPTAAAFSLRAAVFYAAWSHIQSDLLLPSGLPFTANIGSGRNEGIEAEASWRRGGLDLSANLVLQDPELNRPDPGFAARPDARLPGAPRFSYGLSATYVRPVSSRWSVEAAGRYAYAGPSRLTFDAATAPRMGGYGDLRLSVGARTEAVRVALYLENATDSRGDTFAYGNPFSLRLAPQATPQRPRTLGVSVKREF